MAKSWMLFSQKNTQEAIELQEWLGSSLRAEYERGRAKSLAVVFELCERVVRVCEAMSVPVHRLKNSPAYEDIFIRNEMAKKELMRKMGKFTRDSRIDSKRASAVRTSRHS